MQQAEITQLLKRAGNGDHDVYHKLMPQIYDQLLTMANRHIAGEYHEHTYSRTELVHEAYLKLCNYEQMNWKDRSHFYAIASKCMRQILIDYARKKLTEKRGGDNQKVTLMDNMVQQMKEASHMLDLNDALTRLEAFDKRLAQIVEYRYFGEMTIEDTAEVMNISASTVRREWIKARGWLYKELNSQNI